MEFYLREGHGGRGGGVGGNSNGEGFGSRFGKGTGLDVIAGEDAEENVEFILGDGAEFGDGGGEGD